MTQRGLLGIPRIRVLFLAFFGLYLWAGINPSGQAAQREVQVFAELENAGTFTEPLPLPYTMAIDSKNRIFYADSQGRIDLRLAEGNVHVSLDSRFVRVSQAGLAFGRLLQASEVAQGTTVIFGSREAPLAARQCRAQTERLRSLILSALPLGFRPEGLDQPTNCRIEPQAGCKISTVGRTMVFPMGDPTCHSPATIASLVLHEYGRQIFTDFRTVSEATGFTGASDPSSSATPPLDTRVQAAYADILAALAQGDPRIGHGLSRSAQPGFSRDLSELRIFPQDRGEGAEGGRIFSSAWWELRSAIAAQIGSVRGDRLALRTLLLAISGIQPHPGIDPLSSAAIASLVSLSADGEGSQIPGILCTAKRIFYRHGLIAYPSGCPDLSIVARRDPVHPGFLRTTIANAGETTVLDLQLKVRDRPWPVPILSGGSSIDLLIPLPAPLPSEKCGDLIHLETTLRDAQGALLVWTDIPIRIGGHTTVSDLNNSSAKNRINEATPSLRNSPAFSDRFDCAL